MNSHNINAAWLEELTADINMEQTLQNFSTQIDSMLTNVASVLSSTVKGLITASFAFIIAVYISLDGKRVGRHATKLITAYLKPTIEIMIILGKCAKLNILLVEYINISQNPAYNHRHYNTDHFTHVGQHRSQIHQCHQICTNKVTYIIQVVSFPCQFAPCTTPVFLIEYNSIIPSKNSLIRRPNSKIASLGKSIKRQIKVTPCVSLSIFITFL